MRRKERVDDLDRFAARLADRFGVGKVVRGAGVTLEPADPEDTIAIWTPPPDTSWRELSDGSLEALRRCTATLLVTAHQGFSPTGSDSPRPTFTGRAPATSPEGGDTLAVFVSDRYLDPEPAPPSFRVVAIMTAYNEADIIRPTVEGLIAQGIDVHLTDNWSRDGTPEMVEDLVGKGLLAIDRFPAGGRSDRYDWEGLLGHTAEVARSLDHDWCVHHDVDQRRDSPWPHLGYRDALWTAQRWGFDAVDHTLLEFRPTDDDFVPGTEVSDHLRHFEFTREARNTHHVQAWKNDQFVDLAGSGGHDVQFPGRSVFPFNFTLRHYSVRSQAHGEAKVFRDRSPRYRRDELRRGWHYHYAALRPGHAFVRDPASLLEYDPETFPADHLVPRLAQGAFPSAPPTLGERAKQAGAAALRAAGLLPAASRAWRRLRSG